MKSSRLASPIGPIKFLSNKIFNEVSHRVTLAASPCDSGHKFDPSRRVFRTDWLNHVESAVAGEQRFTFCLSERQLRGKISLSDAV